MTTAEHPPHCICWRCTIRACTPFRPKVECQWCGGHGKLTAERLNALFGKNAKVARRDVTCPRCAGRGLHEPKEYRPAR